MVEKMQSNATSFMVICGFCARLFEQKPRQDLLVQLIDNRHLLLEEPFCQIAAEPSAALHNILTEVSSQGTSGIELFVSETQRDYTYLFHMVGASHTSPYESVYRTDDRTLFGPTTLEVRQYYRKYSLKAAKEGSVPDDHIASELAFLELLWAKLDARCAPDEQVRIHQDIESFLSEHLLQFAPEYLVHVQEQAKTPFYRIIANIAASLLESLAEVYDLR